MSKSFGPLDWLVIRLRFKPGRDRDSPGLSLSRMALLYAPQGKRKKHKKEAARRLPSMALFSFGSFGPALRAKGPGTYGLLATAYRPLLSGPLGSKRHLQNDRKRFVLSDQSVSAAGKHRFLTIPQLNYAIRKISNNC